MKRTTLKYVFDDFIEYNNSPNKYNIQKIKYSIGDVNSYSKKMLDLSSKDLSSDEKLIIDLINYIDFPNLKDSFVEGTIEIGFTNDPIYLKLFYDGNKTKVIRYEGKGMHYGIDRLIELIEAIQ